jgi:hypothetical protein
VYLATRSQKYFGKVAVSAPALNHEHVMVRLSVMASGPGNRRVKIVGFTSADWLLFNVLLALGLPPLLVLAILQLALLHSRFKISQNQGYIALYFILLSWVSPWK